VRKLDHDQRRQEIAEVAARLIAARGMAALTTRAIARAMDCSIGVLSHYFASKAEIVTAAFAWASARIEQRLAKALARGASIDHLLPLIEAALPHDAQSRIEWSVRLNLWSHAATDTEAAAVLRADVERNRALLSAVVSELQRQGEVRHDIATQNVAQTLMDLMHGMGFAALLGLHHAGHDTVAAFNTLVDDLRVRGSAGVRRGVA
jgi:AcrR family transcriptional regulator